VRAAQWALVGLGVATPALAVGTESDRQGAAVAAAAAIILVPAFQFLVGILLPAFTRRTQRALETGFWPCAGWGVGFAALTGIVVGVVAQGGGAGKGLAGVFGGLSALLTLAGLAGVAKSLGDWALRRWDTEAVGPLSVLCGAMIWVWGAAVPVVGWIAGLLTLLAGLGAAGQVLLQPHAFDPQAPPKPPPVPLAPLSELPRISVIIPVYNEQSTVHEVIARVRALPLPLDIIVVDDGSTDGTHDVLTQEDGDGVVRVYTSPTNFGKGAAIRIGLSFAQGEVVIIQDADLELDPEEYPRLLQPILEGRANVVYGSRFLRPAPGVPFRTRLANRLLAVWCNLLYWSHLTDVSTAYKVFRAPLLRQLGVRAIGFEFCAEVTGKLLRRHERIIEVPVGYHPRTALAGKKLSYLRDGLKAAWWLLWLRLGRR
jgi:hypothetical protein